jgi:hypothetical protein
MAALSRREEPQDCKTGKVRSVSKFSGADDTRSYVCPSYGPILLLIINSSRHDTEIAQA